MKLTEAQIIVLEQAVQTELLKRGYTAKITFDNSIGTALGFKSEFFQTTPILFKDLMIEGSGRLSNNPDAVSSWEGWMSVSLRYHHFGGGSNGFEFMKIFFTIENGRMRDLTFKHN